MSTSPNGELAPDVYNANREIEEIRRRAGCGGDESGDRTQDTPDTRETLIPNDSQRDTKYSPRRLSPRRTNRENVVSIVLHEYKTKQQFSQTLNDHIIGAAGASHILNESDESWHSELFFFTFMVRSHPDMKDTSADNALEIVTEVIMQTLTRTSDSDKAWERMFPVPVEDAQSEFLHLWDVLEYRHGDNPVAQALRRVENQPDVELPDIRRFQTCPKYKVFIHVAAWMQVLMGELDIYIACHLTGKVLELSPGTISRYIKWATNEDHIHDEVFLVRTKEHVYGMVVNVNGEKEWTQHSAEYRFNLELVPELRNEFMDRYGQEAWERMSKPSKPCEKDLKQ